MSVPSYQRTVLFDVHTGEVFKEATESFAEKKSQHKPAYVTLVSNYNKISQGDDVNFFPSGAHLGGTEAATSCGAEMEKK